LEVFGQEINTLDKDPYGLETIKKIKTEQDPSIKKEIPMDSTNMNVNEIQLAKEIEQLKMENKQIKKQVAKLKMSKRKLKSDCKQIKKYEQITQ
jgi:hypothetical protein